MRQIVLLANPAPLWRTRRLVFPCADGVADHDAGEVVAAPVCSGYAGGTGGGACSAEEKERGDAEAEEGEHGCGVGWE